MSEASYRYYSLDRSGQIHNAEWFEAATDADARHQVQSKFPDSVCEIWQGNRLVARIKPEQLPTYAEGQI